jgi:hypothetical protein
MDEKVYPDAATRIMDIVKSVCGDKFTYFLYLPDNFAPPDAAFPLVIVDLVSEGPYKVGPTTADEFTETVYIHLMVDLKIGLGAPDDVNPVKQQLKNFVSGRDPNTGYFLPDTLMYALRTYLTLQSPVVAGQIPINNDVKVTYAEGHYKNLPETRDAVIEVTVYQRQIVPNRS